MIKHYIIPEYQTIDKDGTLKIMPTRIKIDDKWYSINKSAWKRRQIEESEIFKNIQEEKRKYPKKKGRRFYETYPESLVFGFPRKKVKRIRKKKIRM